MNKKFWDYNNDLDCPIKPPLYFLNKEDSDNIIALSEDSDYKGRKYIFNIKANSSKFHYYLADNSAIELFCIQDDYFMISHSYNHNYMRNYVCDQIDGIMECMKYITK